MHGNRWSALLVVVATSLAILFTSCSSGRPDGISGDSKITVHLSAGTPIAGSNITIYAINDSGRAVETILGDAGVIGTGGPTDDTGAATVTLSMADYTGPLKIVASGANLSYADPCVPATAPYSSAPATRIQIPADFVLTSYLARYVAGTNVTAPVTLLTTLADHEALAYASGLHKAHPEQSSLSTALSARDALFVRHITTSESSWSSQNLRNTVPAFLTMSLQTLVDTSYAAMFDIALNQLGHDTAEEAGYGATSTAINAISLTELLEQDLDADAQLDGLGAGGKVLQTLGTSPVTLTSQFLRLRFAKTLNTWIENQSVNLSGIRQADLISAGVYEAITGDNSDLFGDPPDSPGYNPSDNTPPELTLLTTVPVFTNQDKLTLQVTATDPSGVGSVSVQNGSAIYSGSFADNVWTISDVVLSSGTNTLTIWAADSADGGPNSGNGREAPYQLTATTFQDKATPAVLLVTDRLTYTREDQMTVAADSSGRAVVPAKYIPGKIEYINNQIFKSGVRLGWGTSDAPTAAQLEEPNNPYNIPILQFAVSYSSQTDAPITRATYSVATSCSGCSYAAATGDLWPSPRTGAGYLYYDLPLADNLIPALDSLPGAATLTVTITLADASGNVWTSDVGSFVFHVVGPPVAVVEDTAYATMNDPKSTYPYTISAGNYYTLFDPSTGVFGADNVVRLAHYYITNPNSKPVAITAPSGSWAANETWTGQKTLMGPATLFPNVTCSTPTKYADSAGCANIKDPGCGGGYGCSCNSSAHNAWFPVGGAETCGGNAPQVTDISGTQVSGSTSTIAYKADSSIVLTNGNGRYVVPAATSSGPGVLSLYVIRPRTDSAVRVVPFNTGHLYRQDLGHFLEVTSESTCPQTACAGGRNYTFIWNDYNYTRNLTAASELLSGQFSVATLSIQNSASEFGEPWTGTTLSFTRTVAH